MEPLKEPVVEEQFILRVQVPELADKLRKWLAEEQGLHGRVDLLFDTPRQGTLIVEGVAYPVSLLDLPTVVESYKTLDDANLVKTTDIGQILLVQAPGAPPPPEQESRDGVTPPMRRARARHFRPRFTVEPEFMAHAYDEVLEILRGGAPDGWTFQDVQEEYVVDAQTGAGSWQPYRKRAGGERERRGPGSRGGRVGGRGGGRGRRKAVYEGEDDERPDAADAVALQAMDEDDAMEEDF